MKKLLIALLAIVVILVAAVVLLPFLIPTETIVARVEQQVREMTGRELTIAGPVDVSVIPNLSVNAENVRFQGFEGGEDLLALEALELRLALWPLISGNVQVDRFVLMRPQINLVKDAQGQVNWDVMPQQTEPQQEGGTTLSELQLGDVEIVDGRVSYTDKASGMSRTAEDVDVVLSLESLAEPLQATASLRLDGRPVELEANVAPASVLMQGGEAALRTALRASGANLSLDGKLNMPAQGQTASPAVAGGLNLAIESLPALMEWATGTAPGALPVETLALTGRLQAGTEQVALSGMELKADDITATGDLAVALGGARPAAKGQISVSRLDLDKFLPPPATEEQQAAPASDQPATDEGWSREPIDLSALHSADADLDISLAGIILSGVEISATTLGIDLENGRLAANLGETGIFGGTVQGAATVNARNQTPGFQAKAQVNGVQAEPLLTRFAGFQRLTGATEASLDVTTIGASIYDIMAGLNGQAQLLFRDGAIKGINIAELVRTVTGGGNSGAPQQTDFAELGASVAIADGIARTDDLRLLAPLLRIAGKGQVMLPERQVDMRIVPSLVASIEGQGTGATDRSGLSVPVLVQGSFSDLSFKPDLAGVATEALRDPAKVKETIEKLKDAPEALREGLGGALGNVLQGQQGQQQPTGTETQQPAAPKPEDAVRGLLQGVLGGRQQQPPAEQPTPAEPEGNQ